MTARGNALGFTGPEGVSAVARRAEVAFSARGTGTRAGCGPTTAIGRLACRTTSTTIEASRERRTSSFSGSSRPVQRREPPMRDMEPPPCTRGFPQRELRPRPGELSAGSPCTRRSRTPPSRGRCARPSATASAGRCAPDNGRPRRTASRAAQATTGLRSAKGEPDHDRPVHLTCSVHSSASSSSSSCTSTTPGMALVSSTAYSASSPPGTATPTPASTSGRAPHLASAPFLRQPPSALRRAVGWGAREWFTWVCRGGGLLAGHA